MARRTVRLDLPAEELPLELARMHGSLAVGTTIGLRLGGGDLSPPLVEDVVVGAGFTLCAAVLRRTDLVRASRARTLADTVGPGMRLLVCGLNPSLTAADAGVGFFTPGNRFWPAALAAGLVSRDRDPAHALVEDGIGMTDLVKRATPRADVLTADDYREGLARVERLCAWLRPSAVCFVGLAGWRAAVNRAATPGWQARELGDSPVYVMPSTSGANASSRLADLAAHLRTAALPSST